MYNFFSNRLKMKAFKTALKQVEAEGFYADLTVDEDAVAVLPDLSRAIAGLSKKTSKNREKDNISETINVAELGAEMDTYIPSGKSVRKERFDSSSTAKSKNSGIYDNMFKSSSSFLDDGDMDEPEFLDSKPNKSFKSFDFGSFAKHRKNTNEDDFDSDEHLKQENNETSDKISSLLAKLREKAEEEPVSDDAEWEPEIPAIEADIEMPEMEKEPGEEPEAAKVTVEVVADIPEPETITKTVYITKEVPVPVEVKPAPKPKVKKTTTPRKKKRKYDADISGGFDY